MPFEEIWHLAQPGRVAFLRFDLPLTRNPQKGFNQLGLIHGGGTGRFTQGVKRHMYQRVMLSLIILKREWFPICKREVAPNHFPLEIDAVFLE